jgi:uncharacterized membrane protein
MEHIVITANGGGTMNLLMLIMGTVALLGSALIGGVFFTFSSFVMKALARVPSAEGIAVMQSINVVVINPSFMGAFMGTAVLSLGIIGFVLTRGSDPAALLFLGGAVSYFAGTFLVTMIGNVPLNNQLAAVSATDPAASDVWNHYLERWTMWNTVRTVAAMLAALLFCLGLLRLALVGG